MSYQSGAIEKSAPPSPVHVVSTFGFELPVSLAQAGPFFGPEGERCWAGEEWNPEFLFPRPAADVEGAVFTVAHGGRDSLWVNTVFDRSNGRMQYVSFVPDVQVSVVDVRLTALDATRTRVEVTYRRTAVSVAANETVEALGARDRTSGPQWQNAILGCLAKIGPNP